MSIREMKRKIQIGETAATITCEKRYIDEAIGGIANARSEIERHIRSMPEFLTSLEPIIAGDDDPAIVKKMCWAGGLAQVGPMASVAGAIAAEGVRSAVEAGCGHCIVDNGGDVALVLEHPIVIGILDHLESEELPAVEVGQTDGKVLGICTSSGVLGHSISFGKAEAATVMATDPALADAFATALGNACRDGESVGPALESLSGIDGILWAMAIADGRAGTMGDVPRLVHGRRKLGDVTVHSQFASRMPVDI